MLTVILLCIIIGKISSSIDKSEKYVWPSSSISSLIPQPESKNGKVSVDSDDEFSIDIFKVKKEQFSAYAEECKKSGFTVDYYGTDSDYSAENKDGYSLSIYYDENEKTMDITINKPAETTKEEKKDKTTTKKNTDSSTSKKASDNVNPDFKKQMDKYEDFFDDYIAFMEKYNKSSDTYSLISDYTDFMQKYSDYMDEMDSIDEEELSDADYAYYVKVHARILEKMADSSLYQ